LLQEWSKRQGLVELLRAQQSWLKSTLAALFALFVSARKATTASRARMSSPR
jgi:hypothetical protein